MTSKEKRERLLGDSRPFIRQFTKDDLWVMWAAYDMGSFPNLGKMDKEQFVGMLLELCKNKSSCLVVEDDCKWFKSGRGPVAFVAITNYGWRIEPHVDFFKWATPRIILRSNVAFFQMVRYSSQVGVCEIRSIEKHANLFEHLKKYGLVFPCGKIPNGDPRGDVFLYYAKGRKEHARADGNRNQLQRDDHGWSGESPSERRNGDLSKPDVQGLERGRSKGHAEPEHWSGGQREVHAEAIA